MKSHKFAELFPLMESEALAELIEDIRENGQRAPITTIDGAILDGRNRWMACDKLGIEPKLKEYKGDDPLKFVLSVNLHRRHLNESQRAIVAAKLANLKVGNPKVSIPPIGGIPSVEAAKSLNVGTRSVERAKAVLKASPALGNQVANGTISLNKAASQVKAKKEEKEVHRDGTGFAIPERVLPMWNRRGEVQEILGCISKARVAVKVAMESEDVLFRHSSVNSALSNLNSAYTTMQVSMPYAVCTSCQGLSADKCTLCKGVGFISKFIFDTAIPEELKVVRAKSCKK